MQYLKLTPYMFSVVVVTFCASGCGYVKYEHFSDGAQWPPLICKLQIKLTPQSEASLGR